MRLAILSIVCLALFVSAKAAPPKKRCCEPGPAPCDNPCAPPMGAPMMAPPMMMAPPPMAPPPMMGGDCCAPGPQCANPCDQQQAMLPPMPPPMLGGDSCCAPGPSCQNPCGPPPMGPPMQMPPMAPPMMPPMPPMAPFMGGDPCCDPSVVMGCANPCAPPMMAPPAAPRPVAYMPHPGIISVKLLQSWDPDKYLDENTPAFQILKGNLQKAIANVLVPFFGASSPYTEVSNVYFRETKVPGNPTTMPKVNAYFSIGGNSKLAGLLQKVSRQHQNSLDGLLVYPDSFSAY